MRLLKENLFNNILYLNTSWGLAIAELWALVGPFYIILLS